MNTKVLHIINSFDTGGAQRQLLEVVSRIDQTKYPTAVCRIEPYTDLEPEFEQTGVPIFRIEKRSSWDVTLALRLARQIRQFKPDIVHTWLYSASIWGRLAALLAGTPFVISSERTIVSNPNAVRHIFWATKILNYRTDLIIVNSQAGRENALQRTHRADAVRVIYNGVDTDRFDHTMAVRWRKEYLNAIGLSPVRITIGIVGRLVPQKAHDVLLQAVKQLVTMNHDVQLVVVGDGGRLAELTQLAADLGLSDRVFFVGQRTDTPQIFALFDVFALSSNCEGFPNVILEAMAMARPVVATNIAGVPEVVQDGVTGWLVPPGDPMTLALKIGRLIDHPEQATAMGLAGRQRVEAEFSMKQMVSRTTALYDELLDGRGNRFDD